MTVAALRTLTADGSVRLIDLGPMSAHGNVYDGGRLARPAPAAPGAERVGASTERVRRFRARTGLNGKQTLGERP